MIYETLFEEQREAFEDILNWFVNGTTKEYVLNGVAGSGKTTLIKAIVEYLQMSRFGPGWDLSFQYACMSFTGKAASVLRKKGLQANTIHSWIYIPSFDAITKELLCWKRRVDQVDIPLIIIDESTFLDEGLYGDVNDVFTGKILYVGDRNQLKNISNDDFCVNEKQWNFELQENHRILSGSNILQLADQVRKTGKITKKFNKVRVLETIKRTEVDLNFFKNNSFDAVLCGTNKTRISINRLVRRSKGYTEFMPQIGETLINLYNDWCNGIRIFNGEMFEVVNRTAYLDGYTYTVQSKDDSQKLFNFTVTEDQWEDWQDPKFKNHRVDKLPGQFTFGYALTVHKSQGSEFNKILFLDEDVSFFTDMKSFRYTAITRAQKHLIIAQ